MTFFRNISIIDWPFRAVLVVVFVGLIASAVWVFRHWWSRAVVAACALTVAVGFVGATINAHYSYFPTIGTLFGRRAADQMSMSDFRKLEAAYIRKHVRTSHFGRSIASSPGGLPVQGVVLNFKVPPTTSHFKARTGQVYLPPIWFSVPHPHLPVIELLHGSPGSPADWTRASFADLTADTYASQHHGYAPILVMPDVNGADWWHDSECVNGPMGNAEQYLAFDVRDAVVKAFGARADGQGWGIAGLSEGGSCALQIGLRHPNLYAAIGDFSGYDHPAVAGGLRKLFFGNSMAQLAAAERAYDPRVLLSDWDYRSLPLIYFACGRHDHVLPSMTRLAAEARADDIVTVTYISGGGHEFRFWGKAFETALPSIMQRITKPPRRHAATRT